METPQGATDWCRMEIPKGCPTCNTYETSCNHKTFTICGWLERSIQAEPGTDQPGIRTRQQGRILGNSFPVIRCSHAHGQPPRLFLPQVATGILSLHGRAGPPSGGPAANRHTCTGRGDFTSRQPVIPGGSGACRWGALRPLTVTSCQVLTSVFCSHSSDPCPWRHRS